MRRLLSSIVLLLCLCCAALAQPRANGANGANNGTRLDNVRLNVSGNVSAQAVLIPRVNARRIFGDEIANNYAVIEVNISNKSPDAALIVHGIFIDYSHWPLSGIGPGDLKKLDRPDGPFAEFQGSTRPSQVASEEYRVVRGQLLDAQMWTKRNLAIRVLTLAGSLASAYTFSLNETGIIRGITQATGVGIPGVATAWPDSTIEQLNRVSDFGWRANQVVPRQGAEVVVCFFPIDRFLTRGFRKLFLKSPALFFAPLQMLVDRQAEKDVAEALGKDLGLRAADMGVSEGGVVGALRERLPCYIKIVRHMEPNEPDPNPSLADLIDKQSVKGCLSGFGLVEEAGANNTRAVRVTDENKFRAFLALDYIKNASLNKVGVTIDGVMSVDTNGIAARAEGIAFDTVAGCGGPDTECFWANPEAGGGVRTGTITGSYMTGGTVAITEADALGLTELKTLPDGSDDQQLRFSYKLTKFVPTGTKLHYKITKTRPEGGASLDSAEREYVVSYTPVPPEIARAVMSDDNKTLTITGAGFIPGATEVKLESPDGQLLEGSDIKVKTPATPTKVELDMDGKAVGCWRTQVFVGDPPVLAPRAGVFAILPSPKLDADGASVKAKEITVKGEQLRDTSRCNGKTLTFQLEKKEKTDQDRPIPLPPVTTSATKWTFKLPAAAETGDWTVQAWHGNKKVGDPVELKRP